MGRTTLKLLPCPFCGWDKPKFIFEEFRVAVACPICRARGPDFSVLSGRQEGENFRNVQRRISQTAADAWNRRDAPMKGKMT